MTNKSLFLATAALAGLILSGCAGGTDGGDASIYGDATGGTLTDGVIRQAGSSTVLPLAEVWAEDFGGARGIQIQVAGGGSGAGATGICSKELDLGDMSRRMKDSEKTGVCAQHGVTPVEWKIAYDALSVVVSHKNTFANDLTPAQLKSIFTGAHMKWNQVSPSFPAADIHLCYPDSDSGTYEYFNEAILGSGASPRTGDGVQQSPDDNVLVSCLRDDGNAIGYFGLAYLEENLDAVKAVKVSGVEPAAEHVNDGTYTPLSRFIYIYTDGVPEGILRDYIRYVLSPEGGQGLVAEVGYVPLDGATIDAMLAQLAS